MSVELAPSELPPRRLSRPVEETAQRVAVHPRVKALLPRFDAPFFQAGLAGYSDGAMRLIARRHGCPFCVTEALLDRTLLNGGKGRVREDPDLIASECGLGDVDDNRAASVDDHPIAGQVMGTHPSEMARASELLLTMGYDVIDVNLACPVKKIRTSNRGGHFLRHPDEAIAVLRAVRDAVAHAVPVTVKLRRSFDDTPAMAAAFERIFDAVNELGYAWSTIHCRTVEQKYLGPGRWEFLEDLVSRSCKGPGSDGPVIFGSGDIWNVRDIFAMLDQCGVHGVSVARGCIGNPWIFRQAREMMAGREPSLPTIAEQRQVLLDHHELACVLHGERSAGQRMRKFGIKFAAHHPSAQPVKADFIRCQTPAEWRDVIERHYGEGASGGQR